MHWVLFLGSVQAFYWLLFTVSLLAYHTSILCAAGTVHGKGHMAKIIAILARDHNPAPCAG